MLAGRGFARQTLRPAPLQSIRQAISGRVTDKVPDPQSPAYAPAKLGHATLGQRCQSCLLPSLLRRPGLSTT